MSCVIIFRTVQTSMAETEHGITTLPVGDVNKRAIDGNSDGTKCKIDAGKYCS